ncbi:hypothetical protein OEZ86_009363 [Tetradesmus obliquus]|nr:hypothetical protein OEZ86_009363 [Tetradesmus obliquus]
MWEFWRGKLSKGRTSPRSTANAGSPRNPDRRAPAVVNFKDLNLSVDDELSEDAQAESAYHEDEDPTNKAAIIQRSKSLRSGAQKNKLIIIMVGLPGRGKTFLCNKLKCYLNWLGHNTAHFNVGNYRRLQKEAHEVQDASFFDSHNKHGVEARTRALAAAVNDVMQFLTEGGQVAIFDATNTTKERRQQLANTFHGRCQYIFIESICNDDQVLENNYRYKMKYSPDYVNVDTEAAIADFKQRILKYNEVYEPIDDRRLHYIKLIDMVTGRGYMDVNRISGYIPGKIVFFLMQVCKAGMTAGQSRKIWLTRHGESCFNMAGRIGGDSGLTARGEAYARLLPDVLDSRLPATFNESGVPVSVWTSTLKRTIATANHLPYPKLRWKALDEIHAGVCDGMTYPEIAAKFPDDYEARKKDKLRYRYPSGESYLDVVQRLEPVVIEMEREREYIMVVGHQAILRAIFGYFMAIPLEKIPRLDIPLHTLIELQPRPDGTMEVSFLPVPVSPPLGITAGPSLRQQQQQQQQQHTGFPANPPVQLPLGATCSDAAAAAVGGVAGGGLGRGSSGYPGRGRESLKLFSCCLVPLTEDAAHAAGKDPAHSCCVAVSTSECSSQQVAKPTSSTNQQLSTARAKEASFAGAAAQTGIMARCDSASSTHAAFLSWAKQQSASRRMSVEQFMQQHCGGSCKLDLDSADFGAMGLADVLAAAAPAAAPASSPPNFHSSAAGLAKAQQRQQQQQLEPFAPHDGWLSGPPKPACHEARVVAADGINALRQTRDGEIEGMLRLLCTVFNVETATVALLTGEAIYITGACGALPTCICPDRWGFCGWSFVNSHHELLVVEDMDKDARFSENFFVCDPTFSLKFYVAAPLVSANGHRLGTLCIMGQQPRSFDAQRGQMLANLAEMLVRQLEARWVRSLQASGSTPELRRSLACYNTCYLVLDLSSNPWRVVHMNEPAREATGVDWGASYSSVVARGLPVPGLAMGPLVGRGSYGRVYRGLLRGQPVAVKIIEDTASLRLAPTGEPLEVSLTRDLKQTGIMATLGYTYSDASAVPASTSMRASAAAAGGGGVRPQRPGAAGAGRGRAALRPGSRVCWMLFEYCDKGVLGDGVLRGWFRTRPSVNGGAPQLRTIGLTALEIAVAMEHLHGQGILHGDLCGGNVMLSKSATSPHGFTAKVGDFGLARINRNSSTAAAGAEVAAAKHPVDQRLGSNEYGTITHMSPEVLLGGGAAFTPAADVYSWGVLLWEMLTGSRAYAGMAAPAVVCQVAVLKRGLAIPKNLPAALDDLLRRALSPEPQDRPSFAEVVTVLTQFVQQSRAVDWEQRQVAVEAAHAEERAAAAAAAAAGEASPHGDAAAGCAAGEGCSK